MNISVQFIHPDVSGRLVQSVNILRHDTAELVFFLQLGQEPMDRIGPGFRKKHMLPVKIEKKIRPEIEEIPAQDHLRRQVSRLLRIQSFCGSEIRDPAGC
jgi:hypothetical protein